MVELAGPFMTKWYPEGRPRDDGLDRLPPTGVPPRGLEQVVEAIAGRRSPPREKTS